MNVAGLDSHSAPADPPSPGRIVIDIQTPSPRAVRLEEPHASPSRHSPILTRTFHPDDPDVRERQRAMDVELARQMSRARSTSIALPRPSLSYNSGTSPASLPRGSMDEDTLFPMLSHHEEEQMTLARGDIDPIYRPGVMDPSLMLNAGHDPHLLVSHDVTPQPRPDMDSSSMLHGMTMYQPTVHANFDFDQMESFAREERGRLGLSSPATGALSGPNAELRRRLAQVGLSPGDIDAPKVDDKGETAGNEFFTQMQQRKISQNVPQPRKQGGKLAMFESPADSGAPFSPPPGAEGFHSRSGPITPGLPLHDRSGHDRPYRFSFYSNTLTATIHARSLAELPHEGQTFEELFTGRRPKEENRTKNPPTGPLATLRSKSKETLASKPVNAPARTGDSDPREEEMDDEANTWWLDVLSPTDEEMRILSKVFSIHPLTTEDIQMEEAREKIELFRNYYLVCFRSFDQDRYSPTYLEPLNYYIVVFREGTLSFHFRPSPHPQNVRRRITQLKDYISVTSDWISYALIDDITDAFGPLIQSIEYEVDSIDELVLILKDTEQSDMLRRIGTCRKKVMGLLRLMGNKADVVKGLAKRCNENWIVAPKSDIGLYLSDIQDHLITMTQNLNHYEKILSRSHSNYLAQISIEMSEGSNQINNVLSRLTALGTILIPMNLITGLWGMNVHVPGQDDQETYYWFIGIICALVAIAVVGSVLTYRLMRSQR